LAGGLMSTSALAQDEEGVIDDEAAAELGRIKVTGSRISRTEMEGAQAVTVITNNDMAVRGYTTVFEALNDLVQNNGYKFEGPESQLFTPDVQTLNLRSIGVGSSLVLVNGRRVSNYPAAYQSDTTVFNYGGIPAAAVERIEILSTGASAIYGSDAIVGVVNIILRQDINDTNVNLLYSQPTGAKGSPGTTRAQIVTGKLFERGSITAALEYQQRDPILGKQFEQYDSNTDYPWGTSYPDRAILDLNYWENYAGNDPYQDPGAGTCEALNNGTKRSLRPNSGYFCGYDGVGEQNFRNAREHYSAFINGRFDLNDNVSLFADVLYFQSESSSNNWSIFIGEDILDTDVIVDTVFGFPYFDWYYGQRQFTEAELGRSLDTQFEDDALTVSVGARGYWRDTHAWELSFTHSQYELTSSQPWWKAADVIDVFLGDFNGVGFFGDNWWEGNGTFGLATEEGMYEPVDVALINSAIGNQSYGNETESQLAQFTMNGDLMEMKYGPLSYAAVVEFERQDFSFKPDELIQQDPVPPFTIGSGWYNLTGYSGEGDRERSALGFEIRAPLHDTLTLNLAARLDNYDSVSSSIGTRTTPSASLEWRPTDRLLIRGGYAESFRAPDLNVVYTETGFFTARDDIVQCAQIYEFEEGDLAGFDPDDCDSVSVFVKRTPATRLDDFSEPLQDETGWSKWVGFSYEIMENMSLQVDLSRIRLENRVELESLQDLLDDEYLCWIGELSGTRCDYVENRIERETDPTTGFDFITTFNASPVNQSLDEVTSIDATFTYAKDTNFGDFGFRVDYFHMLSHKVQDDPDSEVIDIRDDPFLGGWEFRSITSGTLSYGYKDFSTALTFVRRGGTTVWFGDVGRSLERIDNGEAWVPAYLTYNLTAGYNITDNISARLRVQNLFDKGPPADDTFGPNNQYPWYNTFVYPGAGIGRQATLEMNLRFD
jgi:outer membrane receptor for ferrienterochelin and colicin